MQMEGQLQHVGVPRAPPGWPSPALPTSELRVVSGCLGERRSPQR